MKLRFKWGPCIGRGVQCPNFYTEWGKERQLYRVPVDGFFRYVCGDCAYPFLPEEEQALIMLAK